MGEVDLDELEASLADPHLWVMGERLRWLVSAARERDDLRREAGELRGLLEEFVREKHGSLIGPGWSGLVKRTEAALRKDKP